MALSAVIPLLYVLAARWMPDTPRWVRGMGCDWVWMGLGEGGNQADGMKPGIPRWDWMMTPGRMGRCRVGLRGRPMIGVLRSS